MASGNHKTETPKLTDIHKKEEKIEVLDVVGDALSLFTVESFKKVQGQYIVKEITLKDYRTKDRTRFKVKAASVGLIFNPDFFDPEKYIEFPVIEKSMFDVL